MRGLLDGREVVDREARDDGEELPAPPEPLVDEILREGAVVFDERREHGAADLGVARLVALDAVHHLFEHLVAHGVRERRQPDELQVGKTRLEDEVGRDGELDGVGADAASLLDEAARLRDRDPVVRVIELVCPVERGSDGNSSCMSTSGICVWRSSSSAPSSAVPRQALVRPKRAPRRLPTTAANSARGRVAACSLTALRHSPAARAWSSGLPDDPRTASSEASSVCVAMHLRRSSGRVIPVAPVLARQPRTASERLGECVLLADVAQFPIEITPQVSHSSRFNMTLAASILYSAWGVIN